jgi:3-hydroxybutyryl-CoA dehydrogenase
MRLEDIRTVGVVGAGTMGFGIALNFAVAGYETIINDVSDSVLGVSMKNMTSALELMSEEGLLTPDETARAMKRVTTAARLEELAERRDFVTEDIVERSGDKRAVFNRLDTLCRPQSILSSNTSWLTLSDFGSDVARQDKLVITHYFAPAHLVPGVEVVRSPRTSDETFAVTCELMKRIGKVPIRVLKERPGALINRIQDAMRHEANRLWAEGVASAEDIEAGITATFGFRSSHEGPMLHFDLAGMWRCAPDIRAGIAAAEVEGQDGLSDEVREKIRRQYAEGKTWFVDPGRFEEAVEKRDHDFARRLKALYRKGGERGY